MHALGWLPDPPDPRDYIIDQHEDTAKLFRSEGPLGGSPLGAPPEALDISRYCSPVENQGRLGSCTAQAAIGAAEHFQRRRFGTHVDLSRLFLYKVCRAMLGWTGDRGCYNRTTMKGLAVFGSPPERYWPYDVSKFDVDPTPFAFSYGLRYRALRYYRLDYRGRDREVVLRLMKQVVGCYVPIVIGYLVYSYGNDDGEFPMPQAGQRVLGGHAVLVVGYDDNRQIGDAVGALRIRNSWGAGWGQDGYGWLPYGYVLQNLSSDFWALYYQSFILDR